MQESSVNGLSRGLKVTTYVSVVSRVATGRWDFGYHCLASVGLEHQMIIAVSFQFHSVEGPLSLPFDSTATDLSMPNRTGGFEVN